LKENYFTLQNIDQKSELLFSQFNFYKNKLDFNPENSALLILDMQNFFLNSNSHAYIPSSDAIVPKIKLLAKLYNKANLPIIMTRHINTESDAGMMKVWWKDIIRENTDFSCINSEFTDIDSYKINKTQYDAFYKTELEEYLNSKNIQQLIITGVMTHLCCESTIRSAFVRGYETFFPIDSTATYNVEFHKATFTNLSHGFAIPVLTRQIESAFYE
jgi:isochorismate hydrolase